MPDRVLIVGATSAIAAEVARRYARQGSRLFLIGRSSEKLDRLASELAFATAGTIAGDFTECAQNVARVDRAWNSLGGLDLAILAHGYLGDQVTSEQDWEHAHRVLTTNLESAVSFLIPLANRFEAQGSGQIAVLTSVAGERGRPRNYTYGAAKAALGVYLQGMRSRLYPRVTVTNLKLGPVDTPMTAEHPKNASFTSIPQAASGILSAIEAKREEAFVPSWWRPVMAVVKNLPEPWFQRLSFLRNR